MKRTEIEKKLKKELDKERYTHTLGVMYTAAALAMAHHANLEQAMYAGLLHDCAKNMIFPFPLQRNEAPFCFMQNWEHFSHRNIMKQTMRTFFMPFRCIRQEHRI